MKENQKLPEIVVSSGSMKINKTGSWRNLRPEIDYSKCIRCMICWKFCPDACIKINKEGIKLAPRENLKKEPAPEIDYDYCKGCGICAEECPAKCIAMLKEKK